MSAFRGPDYGRFSLALPASPPHLVLMRDPSERLNAALEGRYRIERELGEGTHCATRNGDSRKNPGADEWPV